MTKKRVNWTLSDAARENAALVAAEWGGSMSDAVERALEAEATRLGLRRPADVRTVDVAFDWETLTEDARRLLEIARAQGVLVGESSVTIWDNDDLGLDDTLRIRVRSCLSYEERARKFGIEGLDISQAERGEDGQPTYRRGIGGAPIPSEEYLAGMRRFYGDALESGKAWEVTTEMVRQVRSGKLAGNAAIDEIARQFWAWCIEGDYEPVI